MKQSKNIPEYDGQYSVDTEGNIYSEYKKGYRRIHPDKKGYWYCTLLKKRHLVHRLVAEAFIPNPDNKPCVNHKNGNRADNRVENLEWCTVSENNTHAYRVLKRKTQIPPRAVVNDLGEEFESMCAAGRHYGVNSGAIRAAIVGHHSTVQIAGRRWSYKE